MRHSILRSVLLLVLLTTVSLLPNPYSVSALGLKVAPLLYEEKLADGEKKKGFVDIFNPNDDEALITTEIQAFRQVNINGDLEFYTAEELKQGIQFDYTEFRLKSREALRLYFLLDADKLPKGGVYVTLLFRTTTNSANPDNTSIQPATRVGTHLLIENGGGGQKKAFIKELRTPFIQFGNSLKASVMVSNAGGEKSLAFFPEVSITSSPLGGRATLKSPLVMPGNSRHVKLELPSNHFGLVRVKAVTQGNDAYAWTLAATGNGRWLGPLLIALLVMVIYVFMKYKHFWPEIKKLLKTPNK